MKFLLVVLALSLTACTTQKRTKANLAIDSEPTEAPVAASSEEPVVEESENQGEIDLGLEGSSGPVKVEGTMSAEEEDQALASQTPKSKTTKKEAAAKKKKAASADDDEDDEGSGEVVVGDDD